MHEFIRFGLLVTGDGEAKHLGKLFRELETTGLCHFIVIRKIEQLRPKTSAKKKLYVTGTNAQLPTRDQDIGLIARRFLSLSESHYLILIDDLEYAWKEQQVAVFNRYRKALDTMLTGVGLHHRAAVHFLVFMLEAYYFADPQTVNKILSGKEPLTEFSGDVESIRHPKNDLKHRFPGFDEVRDGGAILEILSIPQILSRPDTCASLRTLFAWCINVLRQGPEWGREALTDLENKLVIHQGKLDGVTSNQ